jgi:tetratricopeptide (TPR) repeat protein
MNNKFRRLHRKPRMSLSRLRIASLLLLTLSLFGCSASSRKARILDRADAYFKAGDYDKARVEYLNLLRADNQNTRAFQQLGFIWMEQGAPLRAIPFLAKVRELAPHNAAARVKLALGLLELGQAAEARKEALAALQDDPSNSEAIYVLADGSRTKEETAETQQKLDQFPNKDTALYHIAAASLALKKEEIGAASDELQQALAIDPNSSRAHLAKASLYLLRKDPSHVGPELKAAAESAPPRSQERIAYADYLAAHQNLDEAKTVLENITKQARDYLPAWRTQSQILLSQKKYDEVLSSLENIFSRDPDNPDGRIIQSEALLGKGETGKAITLLEKLDSTYSNNPVVKLDLGRAYLQNKDVARAKTSLEQAVAANSSYGPAVLALAEFNARSGNPQPAIQSLEQVMKNQPDSIAASRLLAQVYRGAGRFDDAVTLLRQQTEQIPNWAEPYYVMGLVFRQQKKDSDARTAFAKASQIEPQNPAPLEQLIDMDVTENKFDDAVQRVRRDLLEKNPQSAPGHFLLGKIFAIQKKNPEAEAELKKAIEIDPNLEVAQRLLIAIYMGNGELPQAVSELDGVVAKNPKNVGALFALGMAYRAQQNYPKAREAYESLLKIQPNHIGALNNLAVLYSEQFNDSEKAKEFAGKARAAAPEDAAVSDTLGWILYKQKDYQQALPLLQDSASKLPQDGEVQFHLGMVQYTMGNSDAARTAFQAAVQTQADFAEKKEAQQRLAQLENSNSNVGVSGESSQAPNDVGSLLREADRYDKAGDSAKAAAEYEQAFKVNPKLGNIALKIAQLNNGPLHQPGKALEFARKARDLAPNDPQIAAAVGRIALQNGKFDLAYSILQEITRRGSTDAAVLHDLAMANYALGKVSSAREIMQRAMNANPGNAEAEDGKRFLAMTGAESPSETEIESVLKVQPDYVPALMADAAIDVQQNKAERAANNYQNVLKKYPDFAPAQKQLALIYAADSGKLQQAYDLAIKARKAMPDDPELARSLAELSFKRNEFAYAAQLFQESAAKQPLPPTDLYRLGVAQLQSRQEEKGRESLQKALSAGLEEPFAQDAKKRLGGQQAK